MAAHDATWARLAAGECARIVAALGGLTASVDHVGSTAVPGLVAKPILDLQVAVASFGDVERVSPGLEGLGYTHVVDPSSPGHVLYVRPWRRPRSHHVHVCVAGEGDERRHLAVRDFLRAHPDEADAYAELKRRVVARAPGDRLAYIEGKRAYVDELERRAVNWDAGGR